MSPGAGIFARLASTRQSLASGFLGVFKGSVTFDDSIYEDIEDQLLVADLGVHTSQNILVRLKEKSASNKFKTSDQLFDGLRAVLLDILNDAQKIELIQQNQEPSVILMVGVNGVGKTTTLVKMANFYKEAGASVMMAACDTFRAAAIEQLQTWGRRLDIPVIAQHHGGDAAAVAFDAYSSAKARDIDYLLIDSAGRQHTHGDLMEQLKKIRKVLEKVDADAPHEVLITVDAGNGQNVLSQVESFQNTTPLTGLCVTKLDGTAKGGVTIALAEKFGLPIKFIGVGEGLDDLELFNADEFVNAMLPDLATETP